MSSAQPSLGATPEWSTLVKSSLSPRLVRLPILTLVSLHLALSLIHLPLRIHSTLDIALLPLRPTILLFSLLTFITGILPTLVVRRRILARSSWQIALCAPSTSPAQYVTLPLGLKISTSSVAGQSLYRLTLPSTWLSAALQGLLSLVSNLFLLASFAAYSAEPTWWLPYQPVPSTRKSTGSFGRTITTTTHHWRPNEAVWLMILQPFLVGLVASLLGSALPTGTWSIPPLRVPHFPTSLINSLPASEGSAISASSSLSRRVSSSIPPLVLKAGLQYLALSLVLLIVYLPLRIPLFRLLLLLLPPYSALRRLVIPSLRSGYGLTTPSHLITLFFTSSACAFIQGATRSLAANLWEIYASHPLAITASQVGSPIARGGSGKSLEIMIGALEKHAPHSATPPAGAKGESEAERAFFFTHALFDFTALCTDTTTQGASVRRAFFKHFAVPTVPSGGAGGTVSAWERVSEVLLGVVERIVDHEEKGAAYTTTPKPTSTTNHKKGPDSSVAISARSKGKELEVVKGGVIGSATPAPAKSTRPAAATGQSSAVDSKASVSQDTHTTVWQRLVAPPSTAATSSSSTLSQEGAKNGSASASTSTSAPSRSSPPTDLGPYLAPIASHLQTLIKTALSQLPESVTCRLPSNTWLVSSTSSSSSSPSGTSYPSSTSSPLLHLLLVVHAVYTLLLLSLAEDEWGSVTLSERRSLGVERWLQLATRVETIASQRIGRRTNSDGGSSVDSEEKDSQGGVKGVRQEDGKEGKEDSASPSPSPSPSARPWGLLYEEVRRARGEVAREFALGSKL